jgi:hypothetical protein
MNSQNVALNLISDIAEEYLRLACIVGKCLLEVAEPINTKLPFREFKETYLKDIQVLGDAYEVTINEIGLAMCYKTITTSVDVDPVDREVVSITLERLLRD